MAYEYGYELRRAPETTEDGSRTVMHAITALYREVGESDWLEIPEHMNELYFSADDLAEVMAMPTGFAKINAYITLFTKNAKASTNRYPVYGWTVAQKELLLDNNAVAKSATDDADEYLTITLGKTYPIQFAI